MNIIRIENISNSFKKRQVLNNLSFNIEKGTIHALIGPNGAGKTTLIKIILGIINKKTGKVYINDYESTNPKSRLKVGYIPEGSFFPDGLSAKLYLELICMLKGLKYKEIKQWTNEMITELPIGDLENLLLNQFSSGMQKLVLLSQALIDDPDILILDEPAANLDPTNRKRLLNKLVELKNKGKTILISSHILLELETIADNLTVISDGVLKYNGRAKANDNKLTYEFIIKDNIALVISILENNNYELFNIKDNKFFIKLDNKNEVNEILKLLIQNNIELLSFNLFEKNISQIYEDVVI